MKLIYSLFAFLMLAGVSYGQETTAPKVFVLGEQEKSYEQLNQAYSQTLLEASDNNIQEAFNQWVSMMEAMDKYAEKIKFDLKGVRVWLHVFWSQDGTIDHIGYLLRPDSRNANPAELNAFFSTFMKKYKFPVKSEKKFNHYTGATFPTFIQRAN
ncbi:MAG: hypothetical protein DWQ02_07305 [Bacteroidetes bacterium]|nr:MAG: hypothetical protein DWQ02_07305 [Bacteroidota bacterium]